MSAPIARPTALTVALLVLAAIAAGQSTASPSATTEPATAQAPATMPAFSTWRFDLRNAATGQAWIQRDTVFLYIENANRTKTNPLPATPGLEPLTYPNPESYSEGPALAAINAKTGELRWVRACPGNWSFVADPDGTDLWAMAATLIRVDALTGKSVETITLPPQLANGTAWQNINGIRIHGRLSWGANRYSQEVRDPVHAYDVESKSVVDARPNAVIISDKVHIVEISPDFSPDRAGTHIIRRPFGGGNPIWEFVALGESHTPLQLFDSDVLALLGHAQSAASLLRLNSDNGLPRWITRLPAGVCEPGHFILRHVGNNRVWRPFGPLDDNHLYAVDAQGVIHIVDPQTGQIIGRSAMAEAYVCAPRLIDGNLIVVGNDAVISIPFDLVLTDAVPPELAFREAQARALLAEGKLAEAAAMAAETAWRFPDRKESHQLMADVAYAGNDEGAGTIADCRYLEITGERTTPRLRNRALLGRIPTGPLWTPIAPVGLLLFAPSTNGVCTVIDLDSLQVVEERQMRTGAAITAIVDGELRKWGDDRAYEVLAQVTAPPPESQRRDPLYDSPFPGKRAPGEKAPPAEWTRPADGVSKATTINGRMLRSVAGGGIRELIGNQVSERPAVLRGVGGWSLQTTSSGDVYGAGETGLYSLDENFRPKSFIVDLRLDITNPRHSTIDVVDSTPNTIGMLVTHHTKRTFALEVRSKDGKTLLRSEPTLRPRFSVKDEPVRLFKLGDGYFYAGGELLWVPEDPARPVWRFRAAEPVFTRQEPHDFTFGIPRIAGDTLFAPNMHGGVYAFSIRELTGSR